MANLSIDSALLKRLQQLTNTDSPAKVTENALSLLEWAANEAKSGRNIFSADKEATNIKRLDMSALTKHSG